MKEQAYTRRRLVNQAMLALSSAAAAIAIALLLVILVYTFLHGIPYLNLGFLVNPDRPAGVAGGGMRYEIIGTIILVIIGSIIAIPIGLMAGIYLAETGSPKITSSVRFVADILAGVPSIVTGVFVWAIVVRPMHSFSLFSGSVALAFIMIPVVSRTAEEAMRLVPNSMREAALALGISRWRSIVGVVIPGALTGIVTGIMLAVARIAGETAPLIFTAFGNFFGFQGLGKPIDALPLQIYQYALSPYDDLHHQAWAGAFLLIMLVLAISVLVRWISSRKKV